MKYLSKWKREYAADLAKALNNPNVQNCLRDGLPLPYTEQDALAFIDDMLAQNPNDVFAFAIIFNGKCVGSIGAFRSKNVHSRTAEVGYYLAEPDWGKGIMTAALVELCDYLFSETDLLRVYAEPFAHNARSCRVLEKAGFVREGVMKSAAVKCGKVIDVNLYARVKEN